MSKYPYQNELKEASQIQSYILSGGQQNLQQSPAIPDELKGFISKLTPNSTSKDILAAYLKDEQVQAFLAKNPQYRDLFESQTGLVFPEKNKAPIDSSGHPKALVTNKQPQMGLLSNYVFQGDY